MLISDEKAQFYSFQRFLYLVTTDVVFSNCTFHCDHSRYKKTFEQEKE